MSIFFSWKLRSFFFKIEDFRKYNVIIKRFLNSADFSFKILKSNSEEKFHKNKCRKTFCCEDLFL